MEESVIRGEGLKEALKTIDSDNSIDLGEGMEMLLSTSRMRIIINKETGKWREFVDDYGYLLITDDEIDYDAMEKGCPHYSRPDKKMSYGHLNRWSSFKEGICALTWTVYPDGRYFADEDGFGMEHNPEEEAYCIIDKDLNIIVPWQPFHDIDEALEEIRRKRREQNDK